MYEGLIFLSINLVLSYLLIKYYGILGAAFGNTISTSIASLFVFFVSVSYFKKNYLDILKSVYVKPFLLCVLGGLVSFFIYYISKILIFHASGRIEGSIVIIFTLLIFSIIYAVGIFNVSYLNNTDKSVLIKIADRALPLKKFINYRNRRASYAKNEYENELISIFIVTHNRLDFLKQCINSLLPTLNDIKYELIIWDNASTDGTKQFLNSLSNPSIIIKFSDDNLGTNAKGKAASICKGEFIIGIDDDVLSFPGNWLRDMIKAYKSVPRLGYLSTDVIQNEYTTGAKPSDELYFNKSFENGEITIQFGPAGGWCFMISRNIYKKIGNFADIKGRIFFSEDGDFLNRLKSKGYRFGILKDVKVFHATGDHYNKDYIDIYETKMKDYNDNHADNYHKKLRLQKIFDIKGMYNKFLDYAERELMKEDDK
jgi:GT2 family glycosyltransferase